MPHLLLCVVFQSLPERLCSLSRSRKKRCKFPSFVIYCYISYYACYAKAQQTRPYAAYGGMAITLQQRMGRDGPYAHKLYAPQAPACIRGASLAHEVYFPE